MRLKFSPTEFLVDVALILACVWLYYHLKPQPLVQLVTPTQTITRTVNGLPDWKGMGAPR